MHASSGQRDASPTALHFRTRQVGEVEVCYREAGPADGPVILLLHGFPSSGHMFRDLIPRLADRYRVIAPDLPGFGETNAPGRGAFVYSFANLAKTMEGFVDALGLERYAIYVFDYGAPTGFRLALAQPERITAIITQNGNAYEEGLSNGWHPIERYWKDPSAANRDALRAFLTPEAIREQYVHGVPDPSLVSPDGSNLDLFYLARAGRDEIQLDLFGDYKSNVALYPDFQAYFRAHRPPLLAVWGRNDPFSRRRVRKPTGATFPRPRFVSSRQAILRSRRIAARLPSTCANSSAGTSPEHAGACARMSCNLFYLPGACSRSTSRSTTAGARPDRTAWFGDRQDCFAFGSLRTEHRGQKSNMPDRRST